MLEYRIDPDLRLVVIQAAGGLTADEIVAHHRGVREDPAFRPDFRQIIDLRAVTDATGVRPDMSRYAWGLPVPGSRRAFVAARGFVYGVARQNAIYAEIDGANARVFYTVAAAEEWLGVARGTSGLRPDPVET